MDSILSRSFPWDILRSSHSRALPNGEGIMIPFLIQIGRALLFIPCLVIVVIWWIGDGVNDLFRGTREHALKLEDE